MLWSVFDGMNKHVEVITLGKLLIKYDGTIVEDFISLKAALLLVYLALHPGEHTRKKLAMMFWSESTDKQALKNLRTILSSVRQNLPDAILISRDTLSINPDEPIHVDTAQFEQGCTALFSAVPLPDLLQTAQDLAHLYSGLFLADVPVREADSLDDWISDKQRHLHELYRRLLYKIIELADDHSNYDIGLHYARELVSLDPYWDAARQQLMRLLAYSNRANEALLQYEDFAQLLADELDTIPDEATTMLYEQIRSQNLIVPTRPIRSSIVLPDMPFIEAANDIALVKRILNTAQCHLLTIYGISGIGKTALATQLAFERQHDYRDGAYLISLKRARSARDLSYLIAGTLGIDFGSQTSAHDLEEIVLSYLQHRQILLVLDNYEHLLPETDFVQRILEQSSQLLLIVTSQTPLNLFREWLIPLSGLRVPTFDDPNPETFEAVRLFELTAQRINPRFNVQENIAGVIEICQLVDGLPLALILAAGWTQILPISKIIEYIIEGQEFSFPLQHDLPPRHQSLEMMLEYTWNTLTEREQYAMTALSIFDTAFDMDEVQKICDIDVSLLTALIQKSLIQKYDDRYRMHQLVWRYARKKLLYSPRRDALAQRYMDYIMQNMALLQQQDLPLHEYLLTIEMQYASIWNYDWMAKSFQPLYMLTLSRFLMGYWEISRLDELKTLCKLFEDFRQHTLQPDMRLLMNVQLARLHIRHEQYPQANQHLRLALLENAITASWRDWCATFNLYAPLTHLMLPQQPDATLLTEDMTILSNAYLKLATLYLDMCDYETAENFFLHLLEGSDHPIDCAAIMAVRGAIAAEKQDIATAYTHFENALHCLKDHHDPLLELALHTLLLRVSYHLSLIDDACNYFFGAIRLAADLNAVQAMIQLLRYCLTMREVIIDETVIQYIHTTIDHLQTHPPDLHSADSLRDTAEQVIMTATTCHQLIEA